MPRAAATLAVRTFEDHEHGELLVRRETVLDTRFDEDRLPDVDRDALVSDLEHAGALEPDVDLVVFMRLLAVRFRRGEEIDADLESDGFVDDLVATARGSQALDGVADPEGVHGGDGTCRPWCRPYEESPMRRVRHGGNLVPYGLRSPAHPPRTAPLGAPFVQLASAARSLAG
jgi:hypothetical protein